MPMPTIDTSPARRTLHQEVLRHLTDRILDGTLEPGERLSDAELSTWLGVSRTPIREALMVLSTRGLVETQPNRYTRVTEIDLGAFRHRQLIISRFTELAVLLAVENSDEQTRKSLARDARGAAATFSSDAPGPGTDALCAVLERYAQASNNKVLQAKLTEHLPSAQRTYRTIWGEIEIPELVDAWTSLADHTERGDHVQAAHSVRHGVAPILLTALTTAASK